jgi:hypothetical protein
MKLLVMNKARFEVIAHAQGKDIKGGTAMGMLLNGRMTKLLLWPIG